MLLGEVLSSAKRNKLAVKCSDFEVWNYVRNTFKGGSKQNRDIESDINCYSWSSEFKKMVVGLWLRSSSLTFLLKLSDYWKKK